MAAEAAAVVVGEAVVVEDAEEVDGTKGDMEGMEDMDTMVDTEEREDGTSINLSLLSVVLCHVSHELSC